MEFQGGRCAFSALALCVFREVSGSFREGGVRFPRWLCLLSVVSAYSLSSLCCLCPLSVLSPLLAREDFREVSERCQGDSKVGTIVALSLNSLISLTPIYYLLSTIYYLLTLSAL